MIDMEAAAEKLFGDTMKPNENAPGQVSKPETGDWWARLSNEVKAANEGGKPTAADNGNASQAQPITDEQVKGSMAEAAKELGVEFNGNAEVPKEFLEVVKAHKLDGKAVKELAVLHHKEQQKAWEAQRSEWRTTAEADKEFGGANFKASVGHAKAALDKYGTPELKALLGSGLGNHPEIVRFMYRVGKALR